MPTVYANTSDGVVSSLNADANTARNANTGTGVETLGYFDEVGFSYSSGFLFERCFFEIDTSAISVTPTSADIVMYFNSPAQGNYILVRANNDTFDGGLTTSNFGSIYKRPATGTYSGVVQDYSSNFAAVFQSYVTVSLNSTALSNIASLDKFNVCLLNYNYDYLNGAVNPGISAKSQVIMNDFPGTDFDIKMNYVEGSAGRQSQAGGTPTRSELRDGYEVGTQLNVDTDYEFVLKNNLKSQVYFTIEGAQGRQLFESASLRTTTSDSGSNVLGFVTESNHASGIINANCTASFFISSSTHTIAGNTFKVKATNKKVIYPTSSIVYGVDLSIEA